MTPQQSSAKVIDLIQSLQDATLLTRSKLSVHNNVEKSNLLRVAVRPVVQEFGIEEISHLLFSQHDDSPIHVPNCENPNYYILGEDSLRNTTVGELVCNYLVRKHKEAILCEEAIIKSLEEEIVYRKSLISNYTSKIFQR